MPCPDRGDVIQFFDGRHKQARVLSVIEVGPEWLELSVIDLKNNRCISITRHVNTIKIIESKNHE